MIIISNHLLVKTDLEFPPHVVMRVNVAWLKTTNELASLLEKLTHTIYLDYPKGRTKPPKPTIPLSDVIDLAHDFKHKVKYFAVSNVENHLDIHKIKIQLPKTTMLIPKIETARGIENLERIVRKIKTKYIMLDKEDLYVDIDRNHELFERLVEETRKKCRKLGITNLELQGVVFAPHS